MVGMGQQGGNIHGQVSDSEGRGRIFAQMGRFTPILRLAPATAAP